MNKENNLFLSNVKLHLRCQENKILGNQTTINLTPASVLIPIASINNQLVILFTKRTGTVNNHQNQISFPGGKIESNDKNPLSASLRETYEEIGIREKDIEILGCLQPRNTSSGFFIYPFVGYFHNLLEIRLNCLEVEKILLIPIDWLNDPANSHYEMYRGKTKKMQKVLFFSPFEGEIVWGITASLIKEFFSIL